jgi:cytochrome c5
MYSQKLVAFALGDRVTPTAANAAPVPAPRASTPAANASPRPQAQAVSMPAERLEQGRQLTDKFCTTCHGMQSETAGGKTPEGWKATVEAMVGMGAEASDDQAKIITDYLSHTFPPKK